MSLAPPRAMPAGERVSQLLPSITCSSCGHPIPLSSLQEHICQPTASTSKPSASSGRRTPQPPTSCESERYVSATKVRDRPTLQTNATYSHPPRTPLDPPRATYQSSDRPPKSSSPTNPFFPHPKRTPSPKVGQSLPSESRVSPTGSSGSQPDTTSGGGAGMAGVGRRAFAAAAWGVRMGVGLAAAHKHDERTPAISTGNDLPPPTHTPNSASPHSAGSGNSQTNSQIYSQRPTQTPAEYTAGLAQRTVEFPTATVVHAPTASHASQKSSSSAESILSRSASSDAAKPSAIAASSRSSSSKLPFFERYKQMASSSAGAGLRAPSPSVGSESKSRVESMTESMDEGAFDYDNESDGEADDRKSALPWAASDPVRSTSPVLSLGSLGKRSSHSKDTARPSHPKGGSVSSSSSSSRSGRRMGSTSESEEIITPSTSYEGLSDRAAATTASGSLRPDGYGLGIDSDVLEQIGEEAEEEDAVFAPSRQLRRSVEKPRKAVSNDDHLKHKVYSSSPERSRTLPSKATSERRRKTCQKCGDIVGGQRRFVERDGVVLCETDWKKLYLPSCRRCSQPIEKSAVSSSDGQLKGKWHRACFACTRCDQPFAGDDFYVHAGKPWCQHHYHEENNSLCAAPTCRQPIEGACILTAAPHAQRYHPGHLKCDHRGGASGAQTCRESMVEYYDVAGKRFCERHVHDAMRKQRSSGSTAKAEKRRTQLIDLK